MKNTILITLLGTAVALATPSLSFADNVYQFKSGANHNSKLHKSKFEKSKFHKSNTQKSHANTKRIKKNTSRPRFVAQKPPKTKKVVKHVKRNVNKTHRVNKHVVKHNDYKKRHNNKRIVKQVHKPKKHYNKKRYDNKPKFSISWNVGGPTIAYGNDYYDHKHGYNYKNEHRQNRAKRIYKRIHFQTNRIQNGINNGQLVKREVKKLRYEQNDIKQKLSYFKRDGYLNSHEYSKLNNLLDIASENIHYKNNNRLTRYSKPYNYNHNHNHYVQY